MAALLLPKCGATQSRERLRQLVAEFAQSLDLRGGRIRAIPPLSKKATRERLVPVFLAPAPTEQPPRKLSGTRTALLDDLERGA
jgi:hypothetical protein